MVLCLSAISLIEILSWPEIVSVLFEERVEWRIISFLKREVPEEENTYNSS